MHLVFDGAAVAFITFAITTAFQPLVNVPYIGAWDAFCYYWDDGANFVSSNLVNDSLTWENLRAMLAAERINVYEPLALLLKAAVRHGHIPLHFLIQDDSSSGGALAQRRCALLLHGACAVLLYAATVSLLELRRRVLGVDESGRRHWSVRLGACVAVCLWSCHPLRAEVVGWPSAQPYALSTCLVLAAINCHLAGHWQRHHRELTRKHPSDSSANAKESNSTSSGGITTTSSWFWWLATVLFYGLAFLGKAAAVPLPASLLALDLALAPPLPRKGRSGSSSTASSSNKTWLEYWRYWQSCLLRWLPLTILGLGMAVWTSMANRHGVNSDADVVTLDLPGRIHKAAVTLCLYVGLAFWPLNLRPHYDMGPRLASRLGTCPHLPWPSFTWSFLTASSGVATAVTAPASAAEVNRADTGAALLLVHGPNDDAPMVGAEVLAIAAVVLVGCWVAWAALIGCWSDAEWCFGPKRNSDIDSNSGSSKYDGSSSGNSNSSSINRISSNQAGGDEKKALHTSDSEVAFREANTRADSAEAAAIVRGQLAFFVHWLGFWLPVCGIVQHGMVQLGGDRYSYLPDLAACPLVAAAVANALGSPDHKGEQSALLPSSGNRLVRLLMILVGSGTALWACFLTTPGALLFWRSDETALRHGLAIDPNDWRVLDIYGELFYRQGRMDEGRSILERATHALAPYPSLKAKLAIGKNYAFLGDPDSACTLYRTVAESNPPWLQRSPQLMSNLGVCAVRDAFASSSPPSHVANTQEAIEHHMQAAHFFQQAVRLVRRGNDAHDDDGIGDGEADAFAGQEQKKVPWHKHEVETVETNHFKFEAWQANGGEFQGALMW